MWSTSKKEIPQGQIEREHLNALRLAVEDAGDFDPRTEAVYEAIEYLKPRIANQGGLNLFVRGLEAGNVLMMQSGFQLLRKHMGK